MSILSRKNGYFHSHRKYLPRVSGNGDFYPGARRPGNGTRNTALAVVLFLFVTLALPSPLAQAVNSQDLPILLVNGAIYPQLFKASDLPVAFRADSPQPGTEALYLVQCAGPLREDWLEELKNRGARPRGYLASNTLVAAMDAGSYSRASGLGFVHWSGIYQPYFKISPVLQLRLVQGGEVTVLAQLYDSRFLEPVLEALRSMSLEILAWGGDEWCGVVVLRLPVEGLKNVAAMPAVEWLDLCGMGTLPSPGELTVDGAKAVGGMEAAVRGRESPTKAAGPVETVAVSDAGPGSPSGGFLPAWMSARVMGYVSLYGGGERVFSDHGKLTMGILLAGETLDDRQPEAKPFQVVFYATGYGLGIPPQPVSMYSMLGDAYSRGVRVFLNGSVPEGRESVVRYGTFTFQRDAFAWSHPDLLIVDPAGNEGTDADGDGRVDMGSLLGGSCAKNVVSVGGCESERGGGDGPTYRDLDESFPGSFSASPLGGDSAAGDMRGMAAFSSRGPTDDGRIKPDLVTQATRLPLPSTMGGKGWSGPVLWGEGTSQFAYGTSLAAALLAGEAGLLRGLVGAWLGASPSAAMLKALLVNGAEDLYPGQYGEDDPEVPRAPNPVEGWGRPDESWTKDRTSWLKLVDDREGLREGDVRVFRVDVQAMSELRITLAWTDYPSLPQSRVHLVNDLDLRVIGPGGDFYYPNGRHARDPLNNTERVVVDVSGKPGKYTVEVKAWNVPMAPQPYALVIQGR
jgi:hypothetical protein